MSTPQATPHADRTAAQEIEALAQHLARAVSQGGLDARLAAVVAGDLQEAARTGDLAAAAAVLRTQTQQVQHLQALLADLQHLLAAATAAPDRHVRYSEAWWQQTLAALRETDRRDAQAGTDRWMLLFTEALTLGHFDACARLARELDNLAAAEAVSPDLFRQGCQALLDARHEQALHLLYYLAGKAAERRFLQEHPLLHALLYVLLGRIHLFRLEEREQAERLFQQAVQLAPEDGRPLAALGDLYFTRGEISAAVSYFVQATERAPAGPEGYLGMGLVAERQTLWSEARDWYGRALKVLAAEPGAPLRVEHLLVPVTGALYLQLARQLRDRQMPAEALAAVMRALALGIRGERDDPEQEAYLLKGELLEAQDRPLQAAEALYEAGRRCYWRNDMKEAVALFRRVHALDPDLAANYWYLADALLIASHLLEFPFSDEHLLEESRTRWDEGAGRFSPDDHAWAYVVRALISERQANLQPDARTEAWWSAVAYLESALALDPEQPNWWAHLVRLYRNLEKETTALQASEEALARAPQNVSVLEEQAAVLANLGAYRPALDVIDRRLELEPNTWASAVKAFLLVGLKAYRPALALLDTALQEDPRSVWFRALRAQAHAMLGQAQEAARDYREIWSRCDLADRDNLMNYGWAALYLALPSTTGAGDEDGMALLERTAQIAALALQDETTSPSDACALDGFTYLLRGRADDLSAGAERLTAAVQKARRRPELEQLLHITLPLLTEQLPHLPHADAVQAILDRIRPLAEERLAMLEHPTPLQEIAETIEALRNEGDTSGWAWTAAHATAGRLAAQESGADDLLRVYAALHESPIPLPAFPRSLERALEALRAAARSRLRADDPEGAALRYEQAISLAGLGLDPSARAAALGYAGFARLQAGQPAQAARHWQQALERYQAAGRTDAAGALVEDLRELQEDAGAYWAFASALDAHRAALGGSDRAVVDAVRAALPPRLGALLQLSTGDVESPPPPIVAAIALELASDLLPATTDTSWPLLGRYLPELRGRIEHDTGIRIPGIRVREGTSFFSGHYLVALGDVATAWGSILPGQGYCPEPVDTIAAGAGIDLMQLAPAAHPITRAPGCWVPPEHFDAVRQQGFELWEDPLLIAIYHLEGMIRANLADFVDLQETERLLDTWARSERGAVLVAEVLPQAAARQRLARLLRALVREHVPLVRPIPLLEAFQEAARADDEEAALRTARLALRDLLPGNRRGVRHLPLPVEVEDGIAAGLHRAAGRTFLALLPEETQTLIERVREVAEAEAEQAVLITRSAELRPYVRRLVEVEFPDLMVMALDELLPRAAPREAPPGVRAGAAAEVSQR